VFSRHSPQAIAPVHWSKDFVEHLRSVHFALIGTAVAVLIIAFSAKPYNKAEAIKELQQIQQLKLRWSPDLVKSMGKRQLVRSRIPTLGLDLDNLTEHSAIGRVLYVRTKQDLFIARLPEDNWIVSCPATTYRPSIRDVPDVVADFGQWWDELGSGCYVLFPTEVYQAKLIGFETTETPAEIILGKGVPKTPRKAVETTLDLICETHYCDQIALNADVGFGQRIVIPVASKATFTVSRQMFSPFVNGTNLSFRLAFAELNALSEITGKRTFSELEAELAKPSESVVFEVFGLKFPADLVIVGGMISILCVQIYFFVYLRRLRGKLKQSDAGWEVPWIGMDCTRLARTIFLATVSLLPPLSMLILIASEGRFSRLYLLGVIPGWDQFKWFATIAVVVISICLSVLCWRNRPQLTSDVPSCSPSLFE
jgi:hypothetical protein